MPNLIDDCMMIPNSPNNIISREKNQIVESFL